ncbi:MAG: 3-oxo-tetronate kinase [Planctomycetota bacterium]
MANAASSTQKPGPVLGCIADDVTGATDLAINLVQGGMRVVQVMGVPNAETLQQATEADAIVVALKTRSIPAADAITLSLEALRALQGLGVSRFYFKYCSTFDSTPAGNIGPVAEALVDALDTPQTIYCPAFPRAGRTVYRGHLFVFDRLLNESGMQSHPLTPMVDADVVRVLGKQTKKPVGLVDYNALSLGASAVKEKLRALADQGQTNVISDACDDAQLRILAEAVAELPLITGGSGLARQLPSAYEAEGLWKADNAEPYVPNARGRCLVLSGSCSQATRSQLRWARERLPVWTLDVGRLLSNTDQEAERVAAWAAQQNHHQPIVIASTDDPNAVKALQKKHGTDRVAEAIEIFMGRIAKTLVEDLDVRRILVAGGETSGAVAAALDVQAVQIGPEIAAGVTWVQTLGQTPALALAFKSGNFGEEDIFGTAWEKLP